MLSEALKTWLVDEVLSKARWCGYVATLFTNDSRSVRFSGALDTLANVIGKLPDTHPLFSKLEQIQRVDGIAHERWVDEIHLEFFNIGFLLDDGAKQGGQRLIDITDASLTEWQ
jgi:hypothetical protein